MNQNVEIFDLKDKNQYRTASNYDLIAMVKARGYHQLFIPKHILESLVYGFTDKEFIHLSGETGTAKSSLILTLANEPENMRLLCKYLGLVFKPLFLFEIEMCLFETPGELTQNKVLKDGNTYLEDSILVSALRVAPSKSEFYYPVIYLKEMGRVHTSAVQGGLLNLISTSDITLPDQSRIPGGHASIITDSNYCAMEDATHTLVVQDEALKRRTPLNLMLNTLTASEEQKIMESLVQNMGLQLDVPVIRKIIRIGSMVRQNRKEGNLLSLSPPTIFGYLAAYKMKMKLPHMELAIVLSNTLLGNATRDDRKIVDSLLQSLNDERVFTGRRSTFTDDVI